MARRGGTRYLKILRGNNNSAKTQLLQYLAGEAEVSYPKQQLTPSGIAIWVRPFITGIGTLPKILQTQRGKGSIEDLSRYFATYSFSTVAEANRLSLGAGWLAPRAVITKSRGTGTRKTSQLTGKSYKSYGGVSATYPFGAGGSPVVWDEDKAFRTIYARVKSHNSSDLCTYVPGTFS